MVIGSFPPLTSVREIREFDGTTDKLTDFLISVESHIAAYNLPIVHGGYVTGDIDIGWIYAMDPDYQAAPNNYKPNFDFGKRFCILLAERFTGAARNWWISKRQRVSDIVPNCWKPAPPGYYISDVPQTSFYDMLVAQFANPLDAEIAISELNRVKWNPVSEHITVLRSRFTALFHRAGIDDWKQRRNYILSVFDDDMRRSVRFPDTEELLWMRAQEYYITEQVLASSRFKNKAPLTRKPASSSTPVQPTDVTCYSCGEKGHYATSCPKKSSAATVAAAATPVKSEAMDQKRPPTCFNCGMPGHTRSECTIKTQTPGGKIAEGNYLARMGMGKRDKKAPAQSHQLDTASDLGNPWAGSPFYTFTTTPKSPPSQFENLVPSNLVWDKTAKQYVDTPSHYYYETRQPAVTTSFNNIGESDLNASDANPLALMKAMASSVPSVPSESISQKAAGPMHTIVKTDDGRPMLTVIDSGTHVAVVPQSVITGCGLTIDRSSDVTLTSTDDMFTDPIGICDDFKFRIGNVLYATRVYVVRKASFQLLLGTEFIWKAGIGLFPRWGAIMFSLPEFQVIKGTCERITADKAPPPLTPLTPSAAVKSESDAVDPLSGIPLESRQFSFFNANQRTVPFLKVSVAPSVISIGERDYLQDAELDGPSEEAISTSIPKDFSPPTLSDTYVRSVIDIYPGAPEWFKDAMVGLIMKYHRAISWHEYDLGCVTHSPHDIKLVPDAVGIRQASRHHLYSLRNAAIIEAKTRPLVDMGIWTPCEFLDWCAQLVIAEKNRICHDFTDLNRFTIRDAYPIVAMSVILRRFAGKGRFSVWDADRGFNQILNTIEAACKAAFEYRGGHWMSKRMLFGLTNAPATFARNMDPTISEVKEQFKRHILDQDIDNYYDDTTISGPSGDWLGHLRATESFLIIAMRHGWKFKASKIRIAYPEIKILGVIVSAHGKRPDPTKVDALLSMKTPENALEVRSFVGLAHWFQEHVKGLAWNITALNKLAVSSADFEWTPAAEREYCWVKNQMRTPFTLALWSAVKTSCLYTDASAHGLGCFLTQLDDDDPRKEVVIAFGSIALTSAQRKYQITRTEALAFIWSLGHFHAYLCARPFLWKTDHRALKFIFDASKSQVPVLARYKLIADEYKFSAIWISGSAMVADAFSRLCVIPADKHMAMTNREMVMADVSSTDVDSRADTADFLYIGADEPDPHEQESPSDEDALRGKLASDIPAFTAQDLEALRVCSHIRQFLTDGTCPDDAKHRNIVTKAAKHYFLHDGTLYKKRRGIIREVCDSFNLRHKALQEAHDGTAHRGIESTLTYLASRYWFPVMDKFVCRYIIQCQRCQRFTRAHPLDFPNYAFTISDIFTHWNIDFAGPFPEDQFGFRYVCVAVEQISRWAEIRCSLTNTAADAANFLYHDIVCRFGIPKSIHSDNGPHFANEVIERLIQILRIRHKFSTPYYPQSNGRVERLIGTLKSMMVKAVEDTDRDEVTGRVNWQPAIYTALYVYRASPHNVTGVSPAYLLYGENISLPFLHIHQPPATPNNQISHKEQVLERLAYIREAIPGLRGSHHRFARTKEGRKVLVRPTRFAVGEKVLMRNPNDGYIGHGSAFASPYIGPYEVRSIGDKGTYRLATIPSDGKRPGLLRNPINWSRLRRYVPEGDDEFFVKENMET